MARIAKRPEVILEIEYTEGYQERFTAAIMKMYAKRISKQEREQICKSSKQAV